MTENEIKEFVAEIRQKSEIFRNSGFATTGITNVFDKSADIIEELLPYMAIGTVEEFKQAMNFKKYFMELYGEGLEVANWHKNGDLEPLVNFIDEACNWLEMKGE